MDYFEKRSYRVKRELTDASSRPDHLISKEHTYSFDTFEEAFNCFEKMYKMDSALFGWVNKNKPEIFCDESKGPTSYSFSVGGRLIMVDILDVNEIAKEVFGI